MLFKKTFLEIGSDKWCCWEFDRKGNIVEQTHIKVPEDTLWNPEAMSHLIKKHIPKGKVFFLLNSAQTIVRLGEKRRKEIAKQFPFGEDSDKYIFDQNKIGNKWWYTAVPAEIPRSLVEMCQINGISVSRLQLIETLEYRITNYLSDMPNSPFWLLLPQKPGIRLIIVENGTPKNCYFFSDNPKFRIKELTRLWKHTPAKAALVLSDDPGYEWLGEFLKEKDIDIQHRGFEDLKWTMMQRFFVSLSATKS